ncbi:MAG TPA: ribonuclease J [Thermoanaerobaculaceae bacterium]|nr:ribonuclease J [Thermoanaerobaculaceae bacterium]
MAKIVALGGLGEFGANSLLLDDERGGGLLVDAGAAFSDLAAFGVGYEVPDFGALGVRTPGAVVVTHAHDDHIKGLAFLGEARRDLEVLASRTTLAWARRAAGNGQRLAMRELKGDAPARAAGFAIGALPVSHSIPGTMTLRLEGDDGVLVLATDLRLAPSALGETTPQDVLARWGDVGVGVLLLDSTNALVEADPPSEEVVAAAIEEQVRKARGAVIAVSFASQLGRFRQLARAAAETGRLVVPVGRGLVESLEVNGQLGGLDLPPGLVRPARELPKLAHDRVVVVATGSQGEPGSAFSRLAVDLLPGLRLRAGDTVLHAARMIPGNERRLAQLFDHCVRRGARVVTAAEAPIHASGHPHRAELLRILDLLRPRVVIPVHGRRRHLEATAELARSRGLATLVVENGEEISWTGAGASTTGELRQVGRILLDDVGEEVLDPAILRHRRSLAREGLVVAVLPSSPGGQSPSAGVQLHVSGLPLPATVHDHLVAGLASELARAGPVVRRDPDWLRSTMTRWLQSELRRRTRRRPVVVVLVVEL